MKKTLMVVIAHPDDESFPMGSTLENVDRLAKQPVLIGKSIKKEIQTN